MKGYAMRHIGSTLMVLLATCVPSLAFEPPESFEKAFTDAARAAEATKKESHLRTQSLSPYEKAGTDLATKYPDADVMFLESQTTKPKVDFAKPLAWVMLAKLSERRDARKMVSKHAAAGEGIAVLAVSFMPEHVRKEVAESIIAQGKAWESRKDMIELLSYIGDGDTLKILIEMANQEKGGNVRQAAIKSLPCLQEKLKQVEKEQSVWSQCGLRFWRVIREVEYPRSLYGEYDWAVGHIAGSGVKCPVSFLRCHIKAGDVIAIMLAGIQRENDLVEDLSHAAESNEVPQREKVMGSLVQIGSKKAMNALSKQIKPDTVEENHRISRVLSDFGTSDSIELLEQLARDKKYSNSWPAFKNAIKHINERLKQKRTQPELRPSAKLSPSNE